MVAFAGCYEYDDVAPRKKYNNTYILENNGSDLSAWQTHYLDNGSPITKQWVIKSGTKDTFTRHIDDKDPIHMTSSDSTFIKLFKDDSLIFSGKVKEYHIY